MENALDIKHTTFRLSPMAIVQLFMGQSSMEVLQVRKHSPYHPQKQNGKGHLAQAPLV